MLRYDIVFSPDDRGFYAEIIDETGATVKLTKIVRERQKAKEDAVKFIEKPPNKRMQLNAQAGR